MASLAVLACFATVTVNAYVWPSPQLDALETLRFDQEGFHRSQIAGFVSPCTAFDFSRDENTGRANSADWIRTVSSIEATLRIVRMADLP
jgi:hypothetical protein